MAVTTTAMAAWGWFESHLATTLKCSRRVSNLAWPDCISLRRYSCCHDRPRAVTRSSKRLRIGLVDITLVQFHNVAFRSQSCVAGLHFAEALLLLSRPPACRHALKQALADWARRHNLGSVPQCCLQIAILRGRIAFR